jgi:hypothetical protein
MVVTDFQLLSYLHDAKCSEITWDCTNPDGRTMRLLVTADIEAGFSLWEGKKLLIILSNVVAAQLTGWGFVTGDENVDSWRQGVSESLERECKSLLARRIAVPSLRFSITFRSGSTLEVVCSEVSVVERPNERHGDSSW